MKEKYYDAEHKCPHCKKSVIVWSDGVIHVDEITKNPPEQYGMMGNIRFKNEMIKEKNNEKRNTN